MDDLAGGGPQRPQPQAGREDRAVHAEPGAQRRGRPRRAARDAQLHLRPQDRGAIKKFQQAQFNWSDTRVDPNKATIRKLNEFDDRITDKVIVTHRHALDAKYGSSVAVIDAAVAGVVAADLARGILTRVVDLSDPVQMAALAVTGLPWLPAGAPNPVPVTDPTDCAQNKAAIDAIYRAMLPDYLVLLGSIDVIPHQDVVNPVFAAGVDDDTLALGDLPYACEEPYSTDPAKFVGPSRVVGRIPDLTASTHDGTADPAYLVALLERQAQWTPSARTDFDCFGISAAVWQGSSRLNITAISGGDSGLHLSPSEGPDWDDADLGRRMHFVNCHGAQIDPAFYGQDGDDFPKSHDAALLAKRLTLGTVAAAECCYGAELYNPTMEANGQAGMANTYLEEGSYGYMGSATIAYGPADSLGAADLICQYFLTSVLGGASCGRALLEARQRFVAEGNTSPTDLKTLAQFSLMGDPSIHPVDPQGPYRSWTPVEPHGAGGPRAAGLGRSDRRDRLRQVGATLSNVPAARLVEDDERGAEIDDALSRLAEAAGGGFGEIRTFVLEPAGPAQGDPRRSVPRCASTC